MILTFLRSLGKLFCRIWMCLMVSTWFVWCWTFSTGTAHRWYCFLPLHCMRGAVRGVRLSHYRGRWQVIVHLWCCQPGFSSVTTIYVIWKEYIEKIFYILITKKITASYWLTLWSPLSLLFPLVSWQDSTAIHPKHCSGKNALVHLYSCPALITMWLLVHTDSHWIERPSLPSPV